MISRSPPRQRCNCSPSPAKPSRRRWPFMLQALDFQLQEPRRVVIAGNPNERKIQGIAARRALGLSTGQNRFGKRRRGRGVCQNSAGKKWRDRLSLHRQSCQPPTDEAAKVEGTAEIDRDDQSFVRRRFRVFRRFVADSGRSVAFRVAVGRGRRLGRSGRLGRVRAGFGRSGRLNRSWRSGRSAGRRAIETGARRGAAIRFRARR